MSRKSKSSTDLPEEETKNNSNIKMPLMSGLSHSNIPNYESSFSSSHSSSTMASLWDAQLQNPVARSNEEKKKAEHEDQALKLSPDTAQYPDMHRYLKEAINSEFTYTDILKHDEGETKVLGDLFEIFKQEIHQDNKEEGQIDHPNPGCSQIKRLYYPWMKWSWVDQLAEKILQWPLLWLADFHLETKEKWRPISKEERSILLSNVRGLKKTNFVRGFVKGIDFSLFTSVHYFVYMMLAYRFISYFQPELAGFIEFKDIFRNSEQRGIDSLVRTLAKIDSRWLKLILTTPLIIGVLKGLWSTRQVGDITARKVIAKGVELKKIEATNIIARDMKISEIKSSLGGVEVKSMRARGFTSSEVTMDEEKLTANEITAHNMDAKKLSSDTGIIDHMIILEMTNLEGKTTVTGTEIKGVNAKGVTAEEVKLAGSGFVAKSLHAEHMQIGEMIGTEMQMEASELGKTVLVVKKHIEEPGGFFRDVFQEYVPIISNLFSLSGKIQKLEYAVRWDGRLTVENRKQAFQTISRVAKKGKKVAQLNAMESLAKIAHGIGFKELSRLKKAGYSSETLALILYTKAKALVDLRLLAEVAILDEKKEDNEIQQESKGICEKAKGFSKFVNAMPRRIYAYYLLWWLGHPNAWWYHPLFFLYKAAKLSLELYFLSKIVESIQQAINCPDKLGFELGFGYPEWATEFTVDCFYQLIENEFRTINLSDPVDQLVEQISLFRLTELTQLKLSYRNLTGDEMVKILVAIEARGAKLTILKIYDNFADADMMSLASYLKTSKIPVIRLGCQDNIFPGGTELTNQGLQYLVNVLPDTQIKQLVLCFPNIDSTGIIPLANQLNTTKVNQFFLLSSNIDDNGSQSLAEAFGSMSLLYQIILTSPKIGDGTIHALAGVVKNNPLLTGLWITGDFITDEGADYFAQMIQNSLLNVIGLEGINITDSGVVALTNSLQTLPALTNSLSIGSQCGEQGIIALSQKLNQTKFWALRLLGNSFTSVSMQVFSTALPFTVISELQLIDQRFNNETTTQFAYGISSSLITTLIFDNSEFNGSIPILAASIKKLKRLQFHLCNLTSDDVIALASYLPESAIEELYLPINEIGDAGIIALARVLPRTSILILSLTSNQITDVGAQALYNVYRSTSLRALFLDHNNVSSQLLSEIESIQWQAYCQDQLCHANAQYNGYAAVLTSDEPSPRRRHPSDRERNRLRPSLRYDIFNSDISLTHITGFYDTNFFSRPLLPELPSSNSSELPAESLLAPATTGAMIVGVVGLGLLLYQNVTVVRTVVNATCQVLQSCIKKAGDSLKTASNFYSFHSPLKRATCTTLHTSSHSSSFQVRDTCKTGLR